VQCTVVVDAFRSGVGPAGLATAWTLSQCGWTNIRVVDSRPAPMGLVPLDSSRFSLIGVGARGQIPLCELGLPAVEPEATRVTARMDWPPGAGPDEGVLREYTDRPLKTQVLTRDELAAVFYELLRNHTDVAFSWNTDFLDFYDDSDDEALVVVSDHPEKSDVTELLTSSREERQGVVVKEKSGKEEVHLPARLVIAADGAARSVARAADLKVKRYDDNDACVFKSMRFRLPPEWRGDVNYSARSKDGRLNFDALPASREKDYCGVLLLKAGDPLAEPNSSATASRDLLDAYLPQFSQFVDDATVAKVAAAPPNFLSRFRYVDGPLHRGDRFVTLGDAAHTVKPYSASAPVLRWRTSWP